MDKEFVPYEQALALKELGFNYACIAQYGDTEEGIGFEIWNDENFHMWENSVGAPLYQQAFRWFREKYDLQGYVYSTTVRGKKDGDRHFSDYCWNINGIDMPFMKTDARDMESVTYEQAELACLKELIEIVKRLDQIK